MGVVIPTLLAAALCAAALSGATGRQAAAHPGQAHPPATTPAAKQPPSADRIIERYVRALGGEKAIRKINSRVMKGKFEAPEQQLTGEAEILTAAPDRFYSRVTLADEGEFISAFDGKVGWSSDPRGGVHEMQGQELESMRRSSQFQHELRFRELFPQIRVLEKATEEGKPVWVLEATPPGGEPEKFYFDAESGLLVRHDSLQITAGSSVPIEHRYSNYGPVDGVQVPWMLRHKDPNVEWQVTFTEIHQNVPVDPARFSKPASP
jgi:hypothetical protein